MYEIGNDIIYHSGDLRLSRYRNPEITFQLEVTPVKDPINFSQTLPKYKDTTEDSDSYLRPVTS